MYTICIDIFIYIYMYRHIHIYIYIHSMSTTGENTGENTALTGQISDIILAGALPEPLGSPPPLPSPVSLINIKPKQGGWVSRGFVGLEGSEIDFCWVSPWFGHFLDWFLNAFLWFFWLVWRMVWRAIFAGCLVTRAFSAPCLDKLISELG